MPERWTESEEETIAFGAELGRSVLPERGLVLLSGNLGAGKTTLVKGIVAGRGGDPDEVASPTFTLIHEYATGRGPLYHVDLYRLDTVREVEGLGLDELIGGDGLVVIEWGERFAEQWPRRIEISISPAEDDRRHIRVSGI